MATVNKILFALWNLENAGDGVPEAGDAGKVGGGS